MKIYKYIVIVSVSLILSSCNDWLNLEPADTTTETDLFTTGDGYRNALNGIYSQMATSSMYGKALSWGQLDAMAQFYRARSGTVENYISHYSYTNKDVTPTIQSIWEGAYNCIANCNNIIQRVEADSPDKFAKGIEEIKLIKGEALALRALLHLDILRLFAPAKDDGKKYIPYVTTYPCKFQEYTTNNDVLQKVCDDLKAAKQLVGEFDIPRKSWMQVSCRFENDHQGIETDEVPEDLFLAFRGYRMNYYAICGILARAYSYRNMYKEAYDETEIVVKAYTSDRWPEETPMFSFTSSVSDGNNKLYGGILFCLSNQKLYEDFKSYFTTNPLYLSVRNPIKDWYSNDAEDVRRQLITSSGSSSYCNKNVEPSSGDKIKFAKDMIPMIRLSEIYLIRAEYYSHFGNDAAAAEQISAIRKGRNCSSKDINYSQEGWFNDAIIDEARREFIGEGQLFFYYKKLNIRPDNMTKDEQFVLPKPDSEVL